MRKLIVFLLFISIMINVRSQYISDKMGIEIFLQPNTSSMFVRHDILSAYQNTSLGFGYSSGLCFDYSFRSKLSLSFGLSFSDIKAHYVIFQDQGGIPLYPSSVSKVDIIDNRYYVDIPLTINYLVSIDDRWSLVLKGGVMGNIFILGERKITENHKEEDYLPITRSNSLSITRNMKYNLSFLCGAGIKYNFSQKVSFIFLPTFDVMLLPVASDLNSKTYLWPFNIGLRTGLFYKF